MTATLWHNGAMQATESLLCELVTAGFFTRDEQGNFALTEEGFRYWIVILREIRIA